MMEKVNAWFPAAARGMWDQGMIMSALSGELYPIPIEFNQINEHEYNSNEGAVVIASGNVLRGRGIVEQTLEQVRKMPWCVFIHTSDEELAFDSNIFKSDKCKVWLQQIRPPEVSPIQLGDRNILLGWIEGTRKKLNSVVRKPASQRDLWVFSGQINNPTRQDCLTWLKQESGGKVYVTDGFGRGMPREEHLSWLANAAIAPCPSGSYTIETFRMYESLECQCVPICNRFAPQWKRTDVDFWKWFFRGGDVPFPTVGNWLELPPLMSMYRNDPIKLQSDINRAQAWWQQYKRAFSMALVSDVSELISKFGSQQEKDGIGVLVDDWHRMSESLNNLPFIL